MSAAKAVREDELDAALSKKALAAIPEAERLAYRALIERLRTQKPGLFASLLAGKITAGTVEAMCFNLVDVKHRALATLRTNGNGHPGLAIFGPDGKRARAEFMLDESGPTLRLNDAEGRARVWLSFQDPDRRPSMLLYGPSGQLRVCLMIDRDRPRLIVFPRSSSRHDVALVPFKKSGQDKRASRTWSRVVRAVEAGKREAFEEAALDTGFLSGELPGLWAWARKSVKGRRRGTITRKPKEVA